MDEIALKCFIEDLANTPTTENAVNHYDFQCSSNEIRRDNLLSYFVALKKMDTEILLIGEAPGYRGCKKTGIPFSSEKIILQHPFFTRNNNFRVENRNNPTGEYSANIVWTIFDELKIYPLVWSAFPFHPYKSGNEESNRTPTKEELVLGERFIKQIVEIFKIKKIIAVGRLAEKTLMQINIPSQQIRHPSHGGAKLFRDGLLQLYSNLDNR